MLGTVQEYQIQRLIDEKLDEHIIEDIRTLINETSVKNNRRMGRAQFAALQGVTRETTSCEAILTWVRYQIGRQGAWQENEFGPRLLADLKKLEVDARELVQQVYYQDQSFDTTQRDARRRIAHVWLNLLRQYVGQLQRHAIAYQGDYQADINGEHEGR